MPVPSTETRTSATTTSAGARRAYFVVLGLAALAVLLQGLWAGLFVHEGKDYQENWVEVHARGAEVTIVLTIVATVIAAVEFRHRRDLLIGTAALAVLLVVEAYIGGIIGDSPDATVVHFPLAMALMGLAVWLPVRARSLR